MKKFALLSVTDKTNIVEFAKGLIENDFNIIATGNTAKLLKDSSIDCVEASEVTNYPEIFDGRVKTLNPKIFGGILMRRDNPSDKTDADKLQIPAIDLVCVNLYDFKTAADTPNISEKELVEKIDIGGPSLIRAAAKNYHFVSVVTSPAQYDFMLGEMKRGEVSINTRKKLAAQAFSYTASYDSMIQKSLHQKFNLEEENFTVSFPLAATLRYGENPQQSAKLYGGFFNFFQPLHGKELSYNNIVDIISAQELIEEIEGEACAIIKHNNPCGVATGKNIFEAYSKALSCDPVSAFGGIVVFNNAVDEATAKKLNEIFLEVVIAPDYEADAFEILLKKKDRRLIKSLKQISSETQMQFRNVPGGVLAQEKDSLAQEAMNVVTTAQPSHMEIENLKFAMTVAKNVKSNSIVFVKDGMTIGIGGGEVSRLDAVKIAIMKAKQHGHDLTNSVVASDAFFPFADGLLECISAGATAFIQPGGSVRDNEVIDSANNYKVSMIFTGKRHFKH